VGDNPAVLTIEMRTTGRRASRGPSFGVPLPDGAADGGLTLRELIALAVREELAAYGERRAERTFAQVLTEQRIAAGKQAGRIESGERHSPAPPAPDIAVAVALEAFEDGLFLVLVDGNQETDLDAVLMVGPDSTVTFVRLVALAGG
jgi:hypothetical protein